MKEFSLNKLLLVCSLIGWTLFNVASVVQPASNKIIRVALHKGIAMKSGTFGQPVTSYYARLDVGTPPKTFNMSIDIGASESWLPHYSMLGGILFNRLHYKRGYAKKSSSTSVKDNTGFKFEHMQCDLEGKPYEDLFEFKDVIEGLHRAMIRQRFLAVSSASNDKLADLASDGVLAFSGLPMSAAKSRAPLLNMVQAKLIDEPVFSLWLNAEDPGSTDGGELTLGGVNPARYLGVMIKHRVAPSSGISSWSLNLSGVQLGATFVSCYHKGCVATLATATNDIVGPIDDVLRIMDALRSLKGGNIKIEPSSSDKSLHEIDCLMVADLPPLTFVIDDTPYQIQASDYVRHKAGSLNLADIKRGFFTPDTCYIAILPGSSSKEWILGSNFLANYYTSYDYTRREVGIAAKTVSGTRT